MLVLVGFLYLWVSVLTYPISKINFNFEQVGADYSPDAGLPLYLVSNTLPDVRRRNS